MAKQSVFTLKLESDLRNQFVAEAAALDRPASQLVREFMRDFVQRRHRAREHDVWFRAEVENGMREADDPETPRISEDDARSSWRRQRAELEKRVASKAETDPETG